MAVGEYDLNGNIKYLSRLTPGLSGLEYLDNLEYLYIGNQLTVVEEIGSTTTDYMHDFKNQSTSNGISTPEYFYDANGNMIQDLNKEIQVTYNHLNLPEEIIFEEFSGINLIDYLYDGNGRKLSKKVYNRGAINNESSADYVANYIYNPQGNLEKVLTDDGIVDVSLGNQYQYFLKDHLGNNRIMFTKNNMTEELEILQENHYYPFGMKFAGNFLNNSNKLLYNGKELQDDGFEVSRTTGTEFRYLDWYDYGFRHYDPALGRWHCPDPKAEKYFSWSPYTYCYNNPLIYVDPQGDTVKFAGADEQAAYNDYKNTVNSRVSHYQGKVAKNQTKLANAKTGVGRFFAKAGLKSAQSGLSTYQGIQGELSRAESSSTVFKVRMGSNISSSSGGGNIRFNSNTSEIDINIGTNGDWTTMQRMSHEFKHADQYLNGEIDFRSSGSYGMFYDQTDEVAAFQRQNLFSGPKVDATSFVSQHYSYLGSDPLSIHSSPYKAQLYSNTMSQGYRGDKIPNLIYNGWQGHINVGRNLFMIDYGF